MTKYGKWEPITPIAEGGQGTVYLARNTELVNLEDIKKRVARAHLELVPTSTEGKQIENAELLAKAVLAYHRAESGEACGALKVLHSAENGDEYSQQLERMKKEIQAMRSLSHPNIVQILDESLEDRWFVTEFFPEGPLSQGLGRCRGDFVAALTRFRPLVEAVSKMHDRNLVHRDIKPDNVFLSSGKLVLGDLGLVYFVDQKRTRVTGTFENVGSRDWMPGWAMGMRVEDIRPSFDVFSLGKLLWSLVSGRPRLQLWYHHKDQFELEKMFPRDPGIRWARIILDRCIVEEEKDCLPSARQLLELVDTVLPAVRRNCQVVQEGLPRLCRVCGRAEYQELKGDHLRGLRPEGFPTLRIFSCTFCGHAEFFYFPGQKPPAWS